MFPGAPEPFIDLSTGINPFSYPLPALSADDFARLPDRARIRALAATAAHWYGANQPDAVIPAPGTQVLLPIAAALVPPGRAAILGPTYAEHARAAVLAKHQVVQASTLDQLGEADLAVIVNPNNPDGRIVSRADLAELATRLHGRGGTLVIDEAFADVASDSVSFAADVDKFANVVVLRSFGKFFGLAGLRLGFALASPDLARRIDAQLGPWAVSGPAIAVAEQAMADAAWAAQVRGKLAHLAMTLDRILTDTGLRIVGGTTLYRLTESSNAQELFGRLGAAGILVRRFDENPHWLRWGIPGSDVAWQRLRAALRG